MAGSSHRLASLGEEEVLNLFLMVFLLPSGLLVRAILYFMMGIWALLHVATMCDNQL